MKRKLRSPLMLDQVKSMIDGRLSVDTILEDNAYWMGYITALNDCGFLTDTGLKELTTYLREQCDQMYCPLDQEDISASPEEILRAIQDKYPTVDAPKKSLNFDILKKEESNEDA